MSKKKLLVSHSRLRKRDTLLEAMIAMERTSSNTSITYSVALTSLLTNANKMVVEIVRAARAMR